MSGIAATPPTPAVCACECPYASVDGYSAARSLLILPVSLAVAAAEAVPPPPRALILYGSRRENGSVKLRKVWNEPVSRVLPGVGVYTSLSEKTRGTK